MALVHHAKREINAKIVYFGPERAGKSTSLRYVYDRIKPELRGNLKSVSLGGSSLLFFDFSPFEHPVFGGYRLRLHIHTLQGRVANPAAWKMTLKGIDGLVFVVDATKEDSSAAGQSLALLRDILGGYGIGLGDIPLVLQCNTPGRSGQVTVEGLANHLGLGGRPAFSAIGGSGSGVLEALACLSRLVMEGIGERNDLSREPSAAGAVSGPPATITGSGDFQRAGIPGENGVPAMLESIADTSPLNDEQRVVVAEEGLTIDGGTVRIPLDVSAFGGVRRLVVTVSVEAPDACAMRAPDML